MSKEATCRVDCRRPYLLLSAICFYFLYHLFYLTIFFCRNVRTMIKEASWWGNRFVLSGSDCGNYFAWDTTTAEIVLMKEADRWRISIYLSIIYLSIFYLYIYLSNLHFIQFEIVVIRHVVNCVQPHPYLPLLATSGIDYNIKLWAPTAEQSTFMKEEVADVVR